MQNSIIICTAGHVDHGKTAMVKALTGIDCDTHPEEKRRGITINLGFAYLPLPSGGNLAFIDVPGHHRFINTMISGAGTVDYAILVVAADDSVMPQTIEHLKIMELLGIKRGLTVITKTDLVDEQLLSLCTQEIKEAIKNSFLEQSPVFNISVQNGTGIEDLKRYLCNLSFLKEQGLSREIFRMYIDRVFVLKGFGTIVTGSVLGASITRGDKVYLFPLAKIAKIRHLQKHGSPVSEICKGERAALNLIDVDRVFLKPGVMISNRSLQTTSFVDAKLSLLGSKNAISLKNNFKVIFLTGSFKTEAHIYLLQGNTLKSGQQAFAQIYFKESFVPFRKDKFIIRSTSADITFGGGIVLDPYPLRHVRKTEKLLQHLTALSSFADDDYILIKVEQSIAPVSLDFFVQVLQRSEKEILELVGQALTGKVFPGECNGHFYLLSPKHKALIKADFFVLIQKIYEPDTDAALTLDAILKLIKVRQMIITTEMINEFMDELIQQKKIIKTTNGYQWKNEVSSQVDQLVAEVNELLEKNQASPFSIDDLNNHLNMEKKQLLKAVAILQKRKILYQAGEFYFFHSFVEHCRGVLIKFLDASNEGITVAQFRDLIASNRKISMLLFLIYERERIIFRRNDLRFLTPEGKKTM